MRRTITTPSWLEANLSVLGARNADVAGRLTGTASRPDVVSVDVQADTGATHAAMMGRETLDVVLANVHRLVRGRRDLTRHGPAAGRCGRRA